MKKNNVLLIIGGMNRGGSETYLINIARRIDKSKFNLIFVCHDNIVYDYEQEIISLGFSMYKIGALNIRNILSYANKIREIIKKENIDVVETHTYLSSFLPLGVAKIMQVPLRIAHSHTAKNEANQQISRRIYIIISKYLINIFSNIKVSCGNQAGLSLFGNNYYTIIPNSINTDTFRFSEQNRKDIRKKLGLDKNTILVGNVGRIEKVKNHNFMLELLQYSKSIGKDIKLLLVGDGVLRESVYIQAKNMKLQNNIIFYGKSDNVAPLYSAMDVFIMPSFWEGVPVAAIEAQANGLKCIFSDRIDRSTKLLTSTKFISIDAGPECWVELIAPRVLPQKDINLKESNHDINITIHSVERLYTGQL
jgi:glycosyltransferase involved in cell wall biosynthesis